MEIRLATHLDLGGIREIYLCAFPEGEKEIVSELAINLLSEETTPRIIALVAEVDNTIIGHVAFSPLTIDTREEWLGYILAPLGVKPEFQKRSIGSKLVKNGMQRMAEMGVNMLFVYGDPQYYGRFAFSADTAAHYTPPYKLQYPFGWQAITLNESKIATLSGKVSCATSLCKPELW